MRHSSALSCRSCHCERNSPATNSEYETCAFSAACNCSSKALSMRRSLRFFSSCSSSSVMGLRVGIQQSKVVVRHPAENHSFQPVEIVQSILGGFSDRRQEGLARIFLQQAQQLPQGKRHHFTAILLERRHVGCNLR